VSANHQGVSGYTLNAELSAISHNADLSCYISALDPTSYALGAGSDSVKASAAAIWANLRVEGLAINQYVTTSLKYHADAADLAAAKTSLEDEMTEQAANSTTKCTGTSAEAVAAMPGEMRTSEIQDQASSLYLVKKLDQTVPLTAASLKKYYKSHITDYDTLCVSIALVTPDQVPAFEKAASGGESVADLAKQYSQDPATAAKGGAYGCYPPSSEYYASVRADVAGATFDTFAATPQYTDQSGVEYGLFVAATKRTTTPYAQAASTVLSDLQSANAEAADRVKDSLLYAAAVHVDPSFGVWGENSSGPTVIAPSTPSITNVLGAVTLTSGASTYQ
jgi:PPIC-type PPIASE domain